MGKPVRNGSPSSWSPGDRGNHTREGHPEKKREIERNRQRKEDKYGNTERDVHRDQEKQLLRKINGKRSIRERHRQRKKDTREEINKGMT